MSALNSYAAECGRQLLGFGSRDHGETCQECRCQHGDFSFHRWLQLDVVVYAGIVFLDASYLRRFAICYSDFEKKVRKSVAAAAVGS